MDSKVKSEDTELMDDGHAKVDDPVVAPARHAPRDVVVADISSPTKSKKSTVMPIDPNSILTRLFDPDRMQKPAIWKHIKLVAPGPASEPPPGCVKWRSKDAIAAYCLKCKKQFTYTKGTSKTISRHMQAYHGLKNTDGDVVGDSPSSKSKSKEPPLKKRKQSSEKFSPPESTELLLLKWLAGSYRPLSIVQDPGFQQLLLASNNSNLAASYSTEDILRFANTKVEAVKAKLHSQLMKCDNYSLSYETFVNQGVSYCLVKITCCTLNFERNSYTIKVAPTSDGNVVDDALKEYSISVDKLSTVTPKNVDTTTTATTSLLLPGTEKISSPCILTKMDSVISKCLANEPVMKQLVATIQSHVGTTSGDIGQCKQVYEMIEEFLSLPGGSNNSANPTAQQQSMAKALNAILQPFYDASTTISGDPYPMMTIPVIRRINDVLEKIDVKEYVKLEAASFEEFRQALSNSFTKEFSSILDGSFPLMWTLPIDPRLSHLKGLSEEEKEKITTTLIEKVKQLKLSPPNKDTDGSGAKESAKGIKQEPSTMSGLFFGDDAEVEESTENDIEAATAYAKTSVDQYFQAVKSNRKILDPLSWWNANREQFPELAILARKYLGASAIHVNDSGAGRDTYLGENFSVVCFLHDNSSLF